MARNDRALKRSNKVIQNLANGISGNMDALYRNTYMTNPQQSRDLQDLNSKINSNIDKIVDDNMSLIGQPNISKLYTRLSAKSNSNEVIKNLENIFDNGIITDDLYSVFMSNRYLKELDNEIDTVCKYMPKLEEALNVLKDCILSADHFAKDFLKFEYPSSGDAAEMFAERVKDLKVKYALPKLVEEIYEDTSKYGEKFIYRIPYSTAIGKLLAQKPDGQIVGPNRGMNESSYIDENELFMLSLNDKQCTIFNENNNSIFSESATVLKESTSVKNGKQVTKQMSQSILSPRESFNIGIEICRSGIIESAVIDYDNAYKKRKTYSPKSMANVYESSILNEAGDNKKDIQASGNINFPKSKKDKRIISNDGLFGGNKENDIIKVKVPGCVIKKLPREQVVPIYIDDINMGYYYFELKTTNDSESFMGFKNILGDPLTNMRGDKRNTFNNIDNAKQDETIKYIAGQLSQFIDKQFVNANQDLAKEIYMILKYNDLFNTPSIDLIKVTFIQPEDMVHFFFRQDPVTHRGISDLEKGLIPAKIYSSLYISGAIGTLTRGQDKRAYYVKQAVDTNISQTLLNTISQIKQSNFGIRQFQNINNVLNITGKFNDYIIPTNASGDPPIQFEVIPGQEIKSPTELMEHLEEMAVNSIGIPIEIIQARQSVDYAIQLTMSSSKVLRLCYKRQELFEDLLTELMCPIYNYEYNDSVNIKVTLPPPGFLNVTNTNQFVDNIKGYVQSIVDIDINAQEPENEQLKNIYFAELFKHYIGTHIDISAHENILKRCKMKATAERDESHSTPDDGGDDYNY